MPTEGFSWTYVFGGSGDFAADHLRELVRLGLGPREVLTRPDRPAGRGRRPRPTSLKTAAIGLGLTVTETPHPRDPSFLAALERARPDVVLVADYGFLIPREILSLPPRGCVNVHPSLLPRHRGAAPIRRALMEGDAESGVTLMLMDEGLDSGPIIASRATRIEEEEDELSLRLRLAALGASLVELHLPSWVEGELVAVPQDEDGASYAAPLRREESRVDWSRPAREIHNRVRALSPRPGAHTFMRGKRLKILRARPSHAQRALDAGEVSLGGGGELLVGTGDEPLRLLVLQPEGKRAMSAEEFIRGYRPLEGERLGSAPR